MPWLISEDSKISQYLPPVSCADSPEGHTASLSSAGAIAVSMFCKHLTDASVAALMRLVTGEINQFRSEYYV